MGIIRVQEHRWIWTLLRCRHGVGSAPVNILRACPSMRSHAAAPPLAAAAAAAASGGPWRFLAKAKIMSKRGFRVGLTKGRQVGGPRLALTAGLAQACLFNTAVKPADQPGVWRQHPQGSVVLRCDSLLSGLLLVL
ncbi:hypothetical protein O3P69_016583 [Scylla paramamosain]|uniref:Uncharacterized protein n=1 Tax=Scylla paramamosain TaxID=85552 RepID=A0AAW0SYE0_SCYPA